MNGLYSMVQFIMALVGILLMVVIWEKIQTTILTWRSICAWHPEKEAFKRIKEAEEAKRDADSYADSVFHQMGHILERLGQIEQRLNEETEEQQETKAGEYVTRKELVGVINRLGAMIKKTKAETIAECEQLIANMLQALDEFAEN